jgi:hypothetical protein
LDGDVDDDEDEDDVVTVDSVGEVVDSDDEVAVAVVAIEDVRGFIVLSVNCNGLNPFDVEVDVDVDVLVWTLVTDSDVLVDDGEDVLVWLLALF